MAKHSEKDVLTDHEYDGIRELDNRLPPWWLYLFYITIIWSVVYMIHFHVIGTGDSSYEEYMIELDPEWKPPLTESAFSFGYHSPFAAGDNITPRKRVEAALIAAAEAELTPSAGITQVSDRNFDDLIITAMEAATPDNLEKLKTGFPELYQKFETSNADQVDVETTPAEPAKEIEVLTDEAGLASGKNIFLINCVACHGQSGEGGIGPNMTDDYYLYGAGMTNTVRIIKNGVPAKGMISWQGVLKKQQILEVASYIQTLPGTNPPNAKAPEGEKFTANE